MYINIEFIHNIFICKKSQFKEKYFVLYKTWTCWGKFGFVGEKAGRVIEYHVLVEE